MRSRLGSLFATALGVLALTPSAFAQTEENPADVPAGTAGTDAPAPEAGEPAPPPPEEKPATDAAAADAKAPASEGAAAEASVGAKVTQPPTAAAPGAAAPEGEATGKGPQVTLEVVPASGYPEWKIRGIPGGSLAATMHGMQFPYLPAEQDRNTLRVGISGFVWNDLSFARILSGLPDTYPDQKRLATQTRGVLRISPTFSTTDGWFAQGQWEAVGQGDLLIQNSNLASTDDLWVRVGKWKLFDITAGRFQAWEIANHYGMGLDINTLERGGAAIEQQPDKPVPAYGLTYYWDRKDGRLGHYAVHLYPASFLRFEMLAELGAGTEGYYRQTNFRPSGILDFGFVKVKGGFEYGVALPQGDGAAQRIYKNGFGGAVQFVLNPWVEGGVSFARGYEDLITLQGIKDVDGSNTVTGYGGFLNVRPFKSFVVGGGVLGSHWESLSRNASPGSRYGDHNTNDQLQQFVAVQYGFWDQFYIKLVGSHAEFDFFNRSSSPFTNELWGLRFRMAVAF